MGDWPVRLELVLDQTSKGIFIRFRRRAQSLSNDLRGHRTAVILLRSIVAAVAIIALLPDPVGKTMMRSLLHCKQARTASS